jgi:hypothetical protein
LENFATQSLQYVNTNPLMAFFVLSILLILYMINWASNSNKNLTDMYNTVMTKAEERSDVIMNKSDERENKYHELINGTIKDLTGAITNLNSTIDISFRDISNRVEVIEHKLEIGK